MSRCRCSVLAVLVAWTLFAGCHKRQKVFELDAPGVNVDVEKSNNGVQVDVRRDDEEEP